MAAKEVTYKGRLTMSIFACIPCKAYQEMAALKKWLVLEILPYLHVHPSSLYKKM